MSEAAAPLLIVVMGVAGAGKTRIGRTLAAHLQLAYRDGDDFHTPQNVAKMAAGVPLDDGDRGPWLDAIGAWLEERRNVGAVVSCSALRRRYRDRLRAAAPRAQFLYLSAEPELVRQRVAVRRDHFMPVSLVDSQLATLEPLAPDEPGVTLDASLRPDAIVQEFLARV